jgi:PAS domain-containing protein
MEKFDNKLTRRFLYSRYIIVPIVILEMLSLVLVYFEDTYVSYGLSHIVQLVISTIFIVYVVFLSATLNRFARQLHNQKKVYDNLPYSFFYLNSKGKVKMERNSYIVFGHNLRNKRLRELKELLPAELFTVLQAVFAELNGDGRVDEVQQNIRVSEFNTAANSFKLYLKPVKSSYSKGYGLLACLLDITEEQGKVDELMQLMHRYRLIAYEQEMLLESLPLALWSRPEVDGRVGYYNQSYYDLTYDSQQEQGEDNFDIMCNSPKQLAEIKRPYHTTRSFAVDDVKQGFEIYEYDRKDGIGSVGYALAIDKDIDSLKGNSEILTLLLDSQEGVSLVFNNTLRLEAYSNKLAELLGVDAEWIAAHNDFSALFDKMREENLLPETRSYKEFKKGYVTMFAQTKDYHHKDNFYLLDGRQMVISIHIYQHSEFKVMNIELVSV